MLNKYPSTIRKLLLLVVFVCLNLNADELMDAKISWKAPTEYSNGEPLKYAKLELKEYRLYYGPSREEVRTQSVTIDSKELSYPLQMLDLSKVQAPVIYFALTAVSKTGQESDLSDIIFFLP